MPQPIPQPAIETPLAPLHRANGAAMGTWFASSLPNHFSDWLSEYSFLRTSAALLDKNYRAVLSFTGADRARYLNALLTNNVRDLQPGQGIASLLLNPQGHILAEIKTLALPDRILALSHAVVREQLLATFEKFIIMDDVTLADETSRSATFEIAGPRAAEITRELTACDIEKNLPDLAHVEIPATKLGFPARLLRRTQENIPSAEFLVPREHAESCWKKLEKAVRSHGGGPAGYTALNALRLEQGIPWFSYDFGEKQIPHEAGLQDTHISFSKGCYIGQEIVERVRSRGQVNRMRVGLRFSANTPPPPGSPLSLSGKETGHVTSAAFSPLANRVIGMGYLRREQSAPGTILDCAGQSAEVIALPLPSPARP
jgi:folate-binding protein YgfZ